MILKIENLGVVKQANIDLSKGLILFCGPNNTGKTYVSYILQAFLSAKVPTSGPLFVAKVAEMKSHGYFEVNKTDVEQYLASWCDAVTHDLGSVFGVADEVCQKLFKGLTLKAEFSDEDYLRACAQSLQIGVADDKLSATLVKAAGTSRVTLEPRVEVLSEAQWDRFNVSLCIGNMFRGVALGHFGGVRMLTVERNSIYTFKTELSISRNELIDRIQQNVDKAEFNVVNLVNASSRRYPQAVRSSLRIANDLENVQKATSPYADIAALMERDLLHGEVSMTKNGDVEFHASAMAKSTKLPFHLSSSIVKTMSSFVIYLRHLARENDTLIIDEPEMNFHPDVQCLLAQIFALLVNRNLRVVVSTHSDYIIRELNALVMLHSVYAEDAGMKSILAEFGYRKEMKLSPENLSVCFFQRAIGPRKGVTVQPLMVEKDGFEVPSIDEVINRQNEIAEFLFDQLHRETEE